METTQPDQTTTPLALGAWLLRPRHTWALLAAALGVPTLVLVALAFMLAADASEGPAGIVDALAAVWAELVQDPGDRLMVGTAAVLAPLAAVLFAVQQQAYMHMTPAGLEAYVPRVLGLGLLRQSVGRWSVRWDDVRGIRLSLPDGIHNPVQRLGSYRLVIETSRGETRLNPFIWFERAGRDHRLGLGELLRFRKLDAARRLESAPLMHAIRARGLDIESETPAAAFGTPVASGYDLARHKGMLVQLALLFGAGVYALVDTFFVAAYEPLGALPLVPFAVTGAVAVLASSQLGRGAPSRERLAVGALTLVALVAAAHPATLRLNAATAEPEIVAYVSLGAGRFAPPDDRLPPIDLSTLDVPEYWARYARGAEHEFTLLRGTGGFYQLALRPVYERTRRFYGDGG